MVLVTASASPGLPASPKTMGLLYSDPADLSRSFPRVCCVYSIALNSLWLVQPPKFQNPPGALEVIRSIP